MWQSIKHFSIVKFRAINLDDESLNYFVFEHFTNKLKLEPTTLSFIKLNHLGSLLLNLYQIKSKIPLQTEFFLPVFDRRKVDENYSEKKFKSRQLSALTYSINAMYIFFDLMSTWDQGRSRGRRIVIHISVWIQCDASLLKDRRIWAQPDSIRVATWTMWNKAKKKNARCNELDLIFLWFFVFFSLTLNKRKNVAIWFDFLGAKTNQLHKNMACLWCESWFVFHLRWYLLKHRTISSGNVIFALATSWA